MAIISFDSENLVVDWVSFNLEVEGLEDPKIIAGHLSKYFTPHVLIDGDGVPEIAFCGVVLILVDLKRAAESISYTAFWRSTRSTCICTKISYSAENR
jgi:hypothetical protein